MLNDWGALGGIVGRLAGDYSQVPALLGLERAPGADEMKHFGAALASFGSVALFHIAGITPEATRFDDVVPVGRDLRTHQIGEADIRALQAQYAKDIGEVDLVVFSAPQLSLMEMQMLAGLLDGRSATIPLLAVTSPQVKPDCDRLGLTARIENAVALVASDGFSARYDLDRIRGVFSRPEHKLAGQSYRGRVLVLDVPKVA